MRVLLSSVCDWHSISLIEMFCGLILKTVLIFTVCQGYFTDMLNIVLNLVLLCCCWYINIFFYFSRILHTDFKYWTKPFHLLDHDRCRGVQLMSSNTVLGCVNLNVSAYQAPLVCHDNVFPEHKLVTSH